MVRDDLALVFRTGLLHELDLVADALGAAGIPHSLQDESVTGLPSAMSVVPAPGFGGFWNVLVPKGSKASARTIIKRLPVHDDRNPGVWGFHPRPEVKKFYRQYGWFLLVGLALAIIWDLIVMFRQ
jgi:hypothetical protein